MARVKVVNNQRSLKEVRHLAEGRLISRRQCSKELTDKYSVPSFGDDMNILDSKRAWLLDEMKSLSPNADCEQLRIMANKLLLYLNPAELQEEIEIIHQEMIVEQAS